ncbi:hypothetical protein GWN26_04355 [Candidatus Saccharibacteria bacterium]|nr:hypothetical protein [Candidatus Saccharibacteria bacterium]
MITAPLYVLLILYAIFLLGFAFFSLFAVYHLIKFGFRTLGNFLMIFIFLGMCVIVLFVSWQYINQIDWLQNVVLFEYGNATQYF